LGNIDLLFFQLMTLI